MRVLDLFSGIGGFALGLERAGMKTVAFCEIDPWARKVLRKHWQDVPIFEDVTKLRGEDVGPVDLVCGGFPCQDISCVGKGKGLAGERSGLWWQMHRLVAELRPRWVLAENVPALRIRGADEVLASMEGLGYACWPLVVGAVHVGAPHQRNRIWLVANTNSTGLEGLHHKRRRNHLQQVAQRIRRHWDTEPRVDRVAHGIPRRVDRLRGLGNAVVPMIPELIGRAIQKAERKP